MKKFDMNVIPLESIPAFLIHLIRVISRTNELVSASDVCEKYERFFDAIFLEI